LRKEAVQKEAKEEEGARAREKAKEKEDRMGQFLDYQVKQLLQRLSDKAVMELPDDFYKLTAEEKLKLLLDAHLEYRALARREKIRRRRRRRAVAFLG
jgi:hypothetical protein